MISFVISKTAVTPWMAPESSLFGNQRVYRWRRAGLWPLRYNPTERRRAAQPQAKAKAQAVATYRKEAMLRALPDELTIKIGGGQYDKNSSWFV